jgi:hypothetical protein
MWKGGVVLDNQIEFMEFFKRIFRGRDDVVAEHWEYPKKNIAGYRPICTNRKVIGICPKCDNYKFPCDSCISKSHASLTDDLLKDHFTGRKLLGVYPLLKDNNCCFVAADFDNHDGEHDPYADVLALHQVCEVNEVPIYFFRSKSGKGYHGYLFFDGPVPAWKARLVMFALIQEAQLIDADEKISDLDQKAKIKSSSFDRLFPNQNELGGEDKIGNLIAMEFQGKAVPLGNTVFLDPATDLVDPYSDQISALKNIQKISDSQLGSLIKDWKLEREHNSLKSYKNYEQVGKDQFEMLLQCDFIKWAYDNQPQVKEPLWLAGISNVVRISPGGFRCCHEFSINHPDYSHQGTEEKARRAFDSSNPITCEWIKRNGYNCGKECGIKSPAGLIHKHKNKFLHQCTEIVADTENSIVEILSIALSNPKELALKVIQNPTYVESLAMIADKNAALFEETFLKIRAAGVKVKDIDSVKKIVKAKGKEVKQNRNIVNDIEANTVFVRDKIKNAPVSETIVIPPGWDLSVENGVEKIHWKESYNGKALQSTIAVASSPILITSRLISIIFETEAIELAWYRDGRWKRFVVDRKVIAAARSITDLSDVGLPVTNVNANDLVKYLADFEAININNLDRSMISHTFGWQSRLQGFLLGMEYLRSDESTDAKDISFKAQDEGNQQIANAIDKNGSYEQWILAVNRLFDFPKAISAVYFSLATPFLEIVGAPNFVVDWSFSTSKGKTTVLRVAGSCWGNPDERNTSAFVNTWDNTKYWIESTATLLNGLPLILDDTKLAGSGPLKGRAAGLVSHVIYLVANGRARGKGSLKGIRKRGVWRTIMLSSGEQPAVEFTQDGGSRARVITLWGPPFGSENQAQLVNEVNLAVKYNYGHAGKKVVQFILNHKDQWDLWKKSYQENQKEFGLKAGSNEVADRISSYFAFVATVIPLIHVALPGLRNDPHVKTILGNLWNTATMEIENADRPKAALRFLYNWAVSNQGKFWDKTEATNSDITEPYGGWAGVWDKSNWNFIGFSTHIIKKVLEDEGFDFEGVVRIWKDRGWLLSSKSGRTKQHRIRSQQVYCYTIKKDAIISVVGDDLNQVNDPVVSDFVNRIEKRIIEKVPDGTSPDVLSMLEQNIGEMLETTFHNPAEPNQHQTQVFEFPFLKNNQTFI